MTIRMEAFCENVARGATLKRAAVLAGYSERSASCIACQLMKQPRILERIEELRATGPAAPCVTREDLLQRLTERFQSPEGAIAITDGDGNSTGFYIPVLRIGGMRQVQMS